jgi:hypothetical protein
MEVFKTSTTWDAQSPKVLVIACSDGRFREEVDELRIRTECQFLVEAHGVERIITMFHGPAEDGPAEASCGDYKRRLPTTSAEGLLRQQEKDAEQIMREGLCDGVSLEVYRCEVTADGFVSFVQMHV